VSCALAESAKIKQMENILIYWFFFEAKKKDFQRFSFYLEIFLCVFIYTETEMEKRRKKSFW
jgi:hypothetical protein